MVHGAEEGNQFVVDDQPFNVNGFNTYWFMVFDVDQSTRGKVTEAFQQANSVGPTVCRTRAFNDGQWRALQKSLSARDFVVSQTISDSHIRFIKSWMQAHIDDLEKVLGMQFLFGEFSVSSKDPGNNSSFGDTLISTVCKTLLDSTKKGGSGTGGLLWQLFPDGTDYMDDGYAVVLSKSASTSNLISLH
ncbi:hypothetical protein RJ641_028661 [Dillenia turbinata]|uniref:Mannan endo-1,4-beta-mannosidase n=1 Tax=Dillenia turbinata TaxID=194707 RepID=A0AAN8VZM6_9MAGN